MICENQARELGILSNELIIKERDALQDRVRMLEMIIHRQNALLLDLVSHNLNLLSPDEKITLN